MCPCESANERTSLLSFSLLILQCSARLPHLTWMVCGIGDKWPNSFVNSCFQNLFEQDVTFSYVLENKIICDFEIQTYHLMSAWQPENRRIVVFCVPDNHWVKLIESKKKDNYLDLAKEFIKLCNMKGMVIPVVIGALDTVTKRLVQKLKDLGIRGRVETIITIVVFEIGQFAKKSPGDEETCCQWDSSE